MFAKLSKNKTEGIHFFEKRMLVRHEQCIFFKNKISPVTQLEILLNVF